MRWVFAFILLWRVGFAEFAVSQEQLDRRLQQHIHYSPDGPNYVGHIYIGGHESQISQGTYIYIKNALNYFRENVKPAFIILELDTPGGQVFPAQKISDALKEIDTQYDIPVVAFINNWAISAGAMLAYSCRFITTVKDGSIGAAQPMSGGEISSEKVNSAIRADFANRAAFFDRNPLIAEAMVDPDTVLVIRENKIIELGSNDDIKATDEVIARKGKLLTLNAQQMIDLGVADLRLLPQQLPSKTSGDVETWPAERELLFTYPFFKHIPHAIIKSYKMDWKTRFFSFLANPIITSLLFLGLVIGMYIEVSTPGFGVAGGIAVMCLALLILSSFAVQTVGWLEYILLGIGIILLLLELFVIPGFGIVGILGIVLIIIGMGAILLPGIKDVHFDFDTKTLNAAGHYILQRAAWLSGALLAAIVIIGVLARYFTPRLALLSPLVHRGEQEAGDGYVASEFAKELIGKKGEALSDLKPSGHILIEGKRYQAVSKMEYLEKGSLVEVISGEGGHLIVKGIGKNDVS